MTPKLEAWLEAASLFGLNSTINSWLLQQFSAHALPRRTCAQVTHDLCRKALHQLRRGTELMGCAKSVYEIVTERILEKLEAGHRPVAQALGGRGLARRTSSAARRIEA